VVPVGDVVAAVTTVVVVAVVAVVSPVAVVAIVVVMQGVIVGFAVIPPTGRHTSPLISEFASE
jgi:drug/metabolite transporter (DMT)-like permease